MKVSDMEKSCRGLFAKRCTISNTEISAMTLSKQQHKLHSTNTHTSTRYVTALLNELMSFRCELLALLSLSIRSIRPFLWHKLVSSWEKKMWYAVRCCPNIYILFSWCFFLENTIYFSHFACNFFDSFYANHGMHRLLSFSSE